ncbi:MAG TPA: hypothetical protein VM912_21055, partial [Terriglobales bacterium]|nr:hypothetical protein [Terriglobales bacterium]
MSERRECKSLALVVEERLKQLRTEQKDRNAEEAVYVKVLQLLSETPRHLVTCNLVLEHAPIGIGTVEA